MHLILAKISTCREIAQKQNASYNTFFKCLKGVKYWRLRARWCFVLLLPPRLSDAPLRSKTIDCTSMKLLSSEQFDPVRTPFSAMLLSCVQY